RSDDEENDVHRKNVEERRPVDQKKRFGDCLFCAGDEIEIEQVVEAGAVAARCDGNGNKKGESEQQSVIAVEAQRAHPDFPGHGAVAVALGETEIDASGEKRGEKDKAFGGGDESEGLIDVGARAGGQMREGDPDKHKTADSVEFDPA